MLAPEWYSMRIAAERSVVSKKPTNVMLDSALFGQAKALGVNLSQACEGGLRQHVAEACDRLWLGNNAAAVAASNALVEISGLPRAALRQF
jgi:antitoxin CcdA